MENPIEMENLGVPLFSETPICIQAFPSTPWKMNGWAGTYSHHPWKERKIIWTFHLQGIMCKSR